MKKISLFGFPAAVTALLLLLPGLCLGAKKEKPLSPDELISKYEKLVISDSLNARNHFELANAYYDRDKPGDAEREYRTAIRLDPKLSEAYTNLGALLNEVGRASDAIEILQKVLIRNPKDPLARSNLGNTYYSEKRYSLAVSEFMRAIGDDPKCFQAYYNLGVAFADAGMYREARRMWEKVVLIAPDSPVAVTAKDNVKTVKELVGER
ncbi:MAG: tetratricopeptide repeat protein [Candidatus Eisenbacteria bacterium]|nr:tetratricopeptide repeat protein [Candidatus Eisenbacteria bacterium]